MVQKKTIVHLSDIHAGAQEFLPEILDKAIGEINLLEPDILVISGDLTAEGYPEQFEKAKEYLDRINSTKKLIAPGNHDSYNVGYLHFEKLFGSRYTRLQHLGITIFAADSSEPDLDDGHIGREHYEEIRQTFQKNATNLKVFVLHHHLLPVPITGREKNILVDAGDVLGLLDKSGVNLVLSGHRHVPHLWRLNNMIILNAGTVSTSRLRGSKEPSYNIIEVAENLIISRKYAGGRREYIFEAPLKTLI